MNKKSQLFKHKKNKDKLKELTLQFIQDNLKYDSLKREYIIDESLYKHIYQLGIINTFKNNLLQYYFDSKQNYPINMNRYKGTITVLRQLCRYVDIPYRYDIMYFNSKYNIRYYFDLTRSLENELSTSNTS
jgi:hypothetical protein